MSSTVTSPLDAASRKTTITRVLLERITDDLEQLGRLVRAQELDRQALQEKLADALLLTLIAVEELQELEHAEPAAAA